MRKKGCRHCGGRGRELLSWDLCRPCHRDPAVLGLYRRPCRAGCGRIGARGRRGLCRACAADPAVGPLFPPSAPRVRRGEGRDNPAAGRVAAEPTRAQPGSAEKVAVMAARVRAGVSCFHPGDSRDMAGVTAGTAAESLGRKIRQSAGGEGEAA